MKELEVDGVIYGEHTFRKGDKAYYHDPSWMAPGTSFEVVVQGFWLDDGPEQTGVHVTWSDSLEFWSIKYLRGTA